MKINIIETYELTSEEGARIIMEHLGLKEAKFQYQIEVTGQPGMKLNNSDAYVKKIIVTTITDK